MALSNFQIDKVLKKHKPNLFHGVFAYDTFDPKFCPYTPIAIVVNTIPLRIKDGGHWVVLYIDSKNNGIFFDSVGLQPWGKFRMFFNFHADTTVFNTLILQTNNYSCGQHCVFFVIYISKVKNLRKLLNLYTFYDNADEMVNLFYKRIV